MCSKHGCVFQIEKMTKNRTHATRLTSACACQSGNETRWCMQVTGGAAQVHVQHVILARVGNGWGLHFSAFSFQEALSLLLYSIRYLLLSYSYIGLRNTCGFDHYSWPWISMIQFTMTMNTTWTVCMWQSTASHAPCCRVVVPLLLFLVTQLV